MKPQKFYDPDPINAPCLPCSECGAECYEYSVMYSWAKRRQGVWSDELVCAECFEEFFNDMPLDEKAELIGSKKIIVGDLSSPFS